MFSDGRAPHAPSFFPWLRGALKPHSSDLGLNGPYRPASETRRARGMGFFSRKGDVRCNGVGVAKMLPVVLRGRHILSPEPEPLPPTPSSCTSGQDNQSDPSSGRKYGPLMRPIEEPHCPVVVDVEDRTGKVVHSSSWVSGDAQRRTDGFVSTCRTSQREPPVEGLSGPLNGPVFSTQVPHRDLGCAAALRVPRRPRPSSELIGLDQNRTSGGGPQREEGVCSRRAVRNQIKRVVDNLEQVVTALRDVQQEMREVVQQIDQLTSSIDLDAQSSGSSGVTAGGPQRPPGAPSGSRGRPPPHRASSHDAPVQRSLLVRPPTPGLSPLPLHPPSSPSPPPVISENEVGSAQTPQGDPPSAVAPPPSAGCPPTDSQTQTVSSGDGDRRASSQVCPSGRPAAQSRRGRKPPPYPHHAKKGREPRQAPPYPEKRRLLSTTV